MSDPSAPAPGESVATPSTLMTVNVFAKRLRSRRKAMGWTLDVLAARVGMSKTGVWQWEAGKSYPDSQNLLNLGLVLGVSLDWLMGAVDNPALPDPLTSKAVQIPEALMRLAERENLSFQTVMVLLSLRVILDINGRRKVDAAFDWTRFYMRIKEWL